MLPVENGLLLRYPIFPWAATASLELLLPYLQFAVSTGAGLLLEVRPH